METQALFMERGRPTHVDRSNPRSRSLSFGRQDSSYCIFCNQFGYTEDKYFAKHGHSNKGSVSTTIEVRENNRLFLSSFIAYEDEDGN